MIVKAVSSSFVIFRHKPCKWTCHHHQWFHLLPRIDFIEYFAGSSTCEPVLVNFRILSVPQFRTTFRTNPHFHPSVLTVASCWPFRPVATGGRGGDQMGHMNPPPSTLSWTKSLEKIHWNLQHFNCWWLNLVKGPFFWKYDTPPLKNAGYEPAFSF